jgi:ubiquinone biosynthesis protein UbiJ
MTPPLVCATVEVVLNRTLRLEPEVLAELDALAGQVIAFTVDGLEWDFFIECAGGGVRVAPDFARRADVHLRGGAVGYTQLLAALRRGEAALPSGVVVEGDAELLRRFAALLRRVDFDPAELIARYTGAAAAERLVGGLKGLFGWGRSASQTLASNTAEYLREETYDLARKVDVEEWSAGIETLRDDVARLEARVKRLERAP